jgi:membrane protein YdbS with pleckstrin-like domain
MTDQPKPSGSTPSSNAPLDAKAQYSQAMRPGGPAEQKDIAEAVIWTGGYSARTMFGSWIAAAVVSIAMLVVVGWFFSGNQVAWWVVLGLILAIWTALLCLFGYHRLSHYYELTNQRLKHRDGILFQTTNRVELIDVDDVSFRQGPIQRILDVGDISVKSSDASHPQLVLKGIANIKKVADAIDDARRSERRRRGVFVENV